MLHDSVAQTLSTMLLELDELRSDQHGQANVLKQIDLIEASTRKALAELRGLLGQLRTQPTGDRDLVKLVKRAIRARETGRRAVQFELIVSPGWPERIPGRTATELSRIVEEAVENAVRHGGAKHIEVAFRVKGRPRRGEVAVIDDGGGLRDQSRFRSNGLGILGMRERAELVGGTIDFAQGNGDQGTAVRISVPLAALRSLRPGPSSAVERPRRVSP